MRPSDLLGLVPEEIIPVCPKREWVNGIWPEDAMKTYLETEEVELLEKAATNVRDRLLIRRHCKVSGRLLDASLCLETPLGA